MFFLPEVLLDETVFGISNEQVVTLLVKFVFGATDMSIELFDTSPSSMGRRDLVGNTCHSISAS
jgi:hypothetical protein